MKTSENHITNQFFFAFLIYVLIVINTEWINLLLNDHKIYLHTGITEGIAAVIVFGGFFLCKKKWKINNIKIKRELVIGMIIIFLYGIVVCVYPDYAFDTYNYHLIAQNPKFVNYFVDDYGYGNFQVWGFRLADRLFYYFRYLFGFRYGTILNPLVLMISYTQLYTILDKIYSSIVTTNKETKFIKFCCNRLIWSLAILFTLDTILMYGTYYVDILAFPIALEIIRLLIENYDSPQSNWNIMYFALLNGIWIAFKLTNIIYVVPCVIVYLILHYKNFRIKSWIIAIFSGLYSFFDYILFNWQCTGNPIFPYFNKIFKSQYFTLSNFKDARWGGNSLFEKIFWIIYAAFKPQYRQSEIYDQWPGTLILGILGTIAIFIIKCLLKEKKLLNFDYWIIFLISCTSALLWSFTTGYSRYYSFGKILWGIMAYYMVVFVCKRYKKMGRVVAILGMGISLTCMGLNFYSSFKGRNWSWTEFNINSWKEQASYVFRDHNVKNSQKDADLFVLTDNTAMGVTELMNSDVYVFNLSYCSDEAFNYKKLYQNKVARAKKIYDIHKRDFTDVEDYVSLMNKEKLYIKDFSSIKAGAGTFELISVEANSVKRNHVWISDEDNMKVKLSGEENKQYKLSFIAGRYFAWDKASSFVIKVYANSKNSEREVASVEGNATEIERYNVSLNIHKNEDYITIKAYDLNGNLISKDEINKVFVLNTLVK